MAMQCHYKSSSIELTPPNSFSKAPLIPSIGSKSTKLVLDIVEHLRQRKAGNFVSKSEWYRINLRRGEYDDLLSRLKKEKSLWEFMRNKVKCDYNSSTETFVLRMPTQLHEVFLARVVKEIQNQLHTFQTVDDRSGDFAQMIKHDGGGELKLGSEDETIIKHDPDASFRHCDARWPGVIIEVSFSQKFKDLPHLADDYILGTGGSIRVVIGFNVDYNTKEGTISMWRSNHFINEQGQLVLEAAETLTAQVFRDRFGNPNLSADAGLKLELRDFAPKSLTDGVCDSFLISSATLCQFLQEAEQRHQETKHKGGIEELLYAAKKQWREHTPPETINSEDEQLFADDEHRAQIKAFEEDSSF